MHYKSDDIQATKTSVAKKVPDCILNEYLNKEHSGFVDIVLKNKNNRSEFGFIKFNITDDVNAEQKKFLQNIKLFFKPMNFYTKITKLRKFDAVLFKWTLDSHKRHIAVDIRYDGRVFRVPSSSSSSSFPQTRNAVSLQHHDCCSICFNPCTINHRSLPCTHHFHSDCIFDWFSTGPITTHNCCPVCRQQFTTARPTAKRITLVKNRLNHYSSNEQLCFHDIAVQYSNMLMMEDSLLRSSDLCVDNIDDYVFMIKDDITIERWTKVELDLFIKNNYDVRAEMIMISKLREEVADDLEHTHHNYACHLSRMLSIGNTEEEKQSKGIVVYYIGNEWNELLNALRKLYQVLNTLCNTARLPPSPSSSRYIDQYRSYKH